MSLPAGDRIASAANGDEHHRNAPRQHVQEKDEHAKLHLRPYLWLIASHEDSDE